MKKLIIALFMLAAQPAFALLPPLVQSIEELKEMIESPDLTDYLPTSEKILSIDTVQDGYLVRTQKHVMLVKVVYKPTNRPGPAKFTLVFQEPIKLQQ